MKAVVVYEAGGPEKLVLENRPCPKVKTGWTLIKVKGFGINHSEIFTRQGLSPSVVFPRILGIECVGVVEETTSSHLQVGQTVISLMGEMGRAFDGSYAEYALLPNQQIYPISSSLSWSDLAAIPETYYTAFGAMKNLRITANDLVLVRGASSGVGISFLKLVKARYPQVKITAATRSLRKSTELLAVGFDEIIEDQNYQLQTDQQFTKILELIGSKSIKDSLSYLREEGIICSVGQLGGQWYLEEFDPIIELKKNVYLTSFYSGNVSQEKIDEMLAYIETHQVPVSPERVYSLEQIVQVHRDLEESHSYGKSVVLLD